MRLSAHLVEQLRGIRFDRYLEPFVGGAGIFARLHDEGLLASCGQIVLNDRWGQLTTYYRVLRERPDELARAIALTPYSRHEASLPDGPDLDELERARRFATSQWMQFCGAHGTKRFSIDHDPAQWRIRKWLALPDKLATQAAALAGTTVECLDALDVIRKYARPDTLIVVAPPYLENSGDYAVSFDRHQDLAELLATVPAAAVVVTYAAHPTLAGLYSHRRWQWIDLQATTTSAHSRVGSAKGLRTEVLYRSTVLRHRFALTRPSASGRSDCRGPERASYSRVAQ